MKNIESKTTKKIVYQEADYLAEYKHANLLSLLADLATTNAIEIGMWNEELQGKYGWVLSKQTFKLSRPIKIDEEITIVTRAKGGKRALFTRTYDIYSNKELIGGIYSLWTLIDIQKRRLIRPEKAGITLPEIEDYTSYVDDYDNVIKDIETTKVMSRQVLYNDIDVNQHMNNTKYIEWALDLLDLDIHQNYFIDQLTMHYKKEIAAKTNVDLYFGIKDQSFKVEFKVEDTIHFQLSGQLKRRD